MQHTTLFPSRFPILVLFLVLTLFFRVESFSQKVIQLKEVAVDGVHQADTVFGTWRYSVADYEFVDDKLLLLTFERNLEHATLRLADKDQKILSSFVLPDEAQKFYKDYQGYINVICTNHIYRITIKEDVLHLGSLPVEDYKRMIMPCVDSSYSTIFFSNYQRDYPQFTYYALNTEEHVAAPFHTVCDPEVLHGYNMEYYFLKPKERIYVRKLADYYGIDKHRVAAAVSGLTTSMFYTPLYSPLFIMKDTVCVFDHSSNAIFKFDVHLNQIDSIPVTYNHPKAWREWKNEVIIDKEKNKAYALYQKGGYYYLKEIDMYTGKIKSSYKLTNQWVKNIKIRDGHVYYIYRPFESLQEQFVYKELISN